MKKVFLYLICVALLFCSVATVSAAEHSEVITLSESLSNDGITIIDKVVLYPQNTRANTRTADRIRSFYNGDTLIAEISFTATFWYDGSTVSVISKSVTQTDTYEGWNYVETSFTSSGGTVALAGKLTKLLIMRTSFTMGLECDANGNIITT